MPFVEGESLRAHLGRGPLELDELIGVRLGMSKARANAHRHGATDLQTPE